MKTLDLSENGITVINFQFNMPELQTLNLEKNRIQQVAPGAFASLQSLKTLNLNQNQLVDFQDIPQTQNLECLILSFNRLQS